MKLYYTLEDDGYHIFDEEDSLFHVHQYEPYIPHAELSYEENAQRHIEEIMASRVPADEQAVIDSIVSELQGGESA